MQENEKVNIQMSRYFVLLKEIRAIFIRLMHTFYIFYRCIIRHRMKYKAEEKLSCRLCYIREIQNRKYILSDYAIYIGIIPITLGSKEWTEITITITENEIW